MNLWILYAVLSGIFVSLRELYIKKFIRQSPEMISFATRFYGSIVFLLIAAPGNLLPGDPLQGKINITNLPVFAGVTLVTVVVTAIATLIRLRLIKTEELSLTTPWLGCVPIFVVLWSVLLYREVPKAPALLGILLVSAGAFTINLQGRRLQMKKASLWMLFSAILLGLTTSLDKIAIGASSAVTYSLLWTIVSAVFMYGVVKTRTKKVVVTDRHLVVQAVLWAGEFLCQMLAVQSLSSQASGQTYVKTLTMLNIVLTTVIGGIIFKERERGRRSLSAVLIFLGAVIVVLFR